MRCLVFSDVHGNLPAFEKMLQQEEDIDLYISLGDIVNYGPWCNECVDLLESIPSIKLVGNHEEYFIQRTYPGKSGLVHQFFTTCLGRFDRFNQISRYEKEYGISSYKFQHTINNAYVFPDSIIDVSGNFFIGHSHHQFESQTNKYHVINVGSVGQNRKEINVINYAIFNSEKLTIDLKSLVYDMQVVITKMKELNYQEECINYYLNKGQRH